MKIKPSKIFYIKNIYVLFFFLICGFANAQIVNIPDYRFKLALIEHNPPIDTNNNGEIEVSEAELCDFINVPSKSITSLEGIQSFTNLKEIRFPFNDILSVDFSQNVLLEKVHGNNSLIDDIALSSNPNLYFIEISNNYLTTIDFSENIDLEEIWLSNNNLTVIDVSNNQNLKFLDISENDLTELDLSSNTSIALLYVWDNNLNYLDIRNGNNISFNVMYAYDNPNLFCIQVDDVNFANSKICDIPNRHGWCKDSTATYSEDCQLGTEDFITTDFQLYPNPAGNLLNIQSKENIENVKIYSSQGILLKEYFSNSIDVSELSAGMYFAQVTFNGITFTKKFIKE
jgi:Leucine-rich repeat (LRR) protein